MLLLWHVDGGLSYNVSRLGLVYDMLYTTFVNFFFFCTVFFYVAYIVS